MPSSWTPCRSPSTGAKRFSSTPAPRHRGWPYVSGTAAAERCLRATEVRNVFCGHTHVPAIFYALPDRTPIGFAPQDGFPAPLSTLRRHVVVVGAVGQPRDGNPAACFALLDEAARTVTTVRIPYDHETTARKIGAAGLPPWLGMRLKIGR
jgi:diadenosine tetraphosphatase ApaH/serine/threonine PP2A family protein phosphatase